jgi:hypothetical protein
VLVQTGTSFYYAGLTAPLSQIPQITQNGSTTGYVYRQRLQRTW